MWKEGTGTLVRGVVGDISSKEGSVGEGWGIILEARRVEISRGPDLTKIYVIFVVK